MKVYLVTSKDDTIMYGDSLKVNGILSSIEKAVVWGSEHDETGYPDITEMTVDYPEKDE